MSTTPATAVIDRIHRNAITTPLSEIARTLEEMLSRRLTAVIAGVKDGKTIARWAAGDTDGIRSHQAEQRLRMTYQIALLLLHSQDSPQIVKAWFIGLNPQLGDISPAEALHEGRLQDVWAAALAFVAGG